MNLNATYVTDSDIGEFNTRAKLNVKTGEVISLEMISDENSEQMDFIISKKVEFKYEDKDFSYDLDDDDIIIDYKNTEFFKFMTAKKLNDSLDSKLKKNSKVINKVKV